jgi:POLQ-like helicase
MSATIGNMNEIGNFLNAYVYTKDFRPVQLKESVKINQDIFVINKDVDGSMKIKLDRKLNFDVRFTLNIFPIKLNYSFYLDLYK